MLTRRFFIGGFAGFAAMGTGRLFASDSSATRDTPLLRFGVLSDVHVAISGLDGRMPASHNTDTLVKAFTYFRDHGADAVVIAGDMAHNGLGPELLKVAEAWYRVFPNDRAPDGRRVERLFITGNHDNGHKRAKRILKDEALIAQNLICNNRAKWWDAAFHEAFQPMWHKTVKGYDFIGCNWMIGDCHGRNEHINESIAPFYASLAGKLDPAKPFFHLQHPQPQATAHGNKVWGQDDGITGRVLAQYPNAVAFSGHSHTSLLDEKAIWQGAFTSCGTASLRNVSINLPGAVVMADGRGFENSTTPNGKVKALNDLKAMEPGARDARQGQLVSVFADRLVFSRHEFTRDLPLGEDLVMPLAAAQGRPFDHVRHAATALAPEFAKSAKLVITKEDGQLRGKDAQGTHIKAPVWKVVIPRAEALRNARAVVYEVIAKNAKGADESFFLSAYPDFCYAPGDKRRKSPLVFKVAALRLAADPVFRVRAVSAWGKKSVALTA